MKVMETRSAGDLGRLHLARLSGGRLVEYVDTVEPGVPKSLKWVMMVSTQAGCPIGCRMCDAGALGFKGNLTAGEIMAQVRRVLADNPGLDPARHPKIKIHFARIGEPALNPAVTEALERLGRELPHPGVIASISTVAPAPPRAAAALEAWREVKDRRFPVGRFQLQFSVHSTDPEARRRVTPARVWSLEEIAAFGRHWIRPGDRKITLNFALGPDQPLSARAIERIFDPGLFLVKITPVNPTRAAEAAGAARVWDARAPGEVARAAADLRRGGFEVILSPSAPEEIAAETSCGQLWSRVLHDEARVALRAAKLESACYIHPDTLAGRARAWLSEIRAGRTRALILRPKRAVLVVVDLQRFFLDRASPAYWPQARAILPNAVALVAAFRAAGRPVLFVRHAHRDPARDGGLMTLWWRKVCLDGSEESRVAPELGARPGEILRKCRYSAFSAPRLEARLRALGAEDLVFCGVATNLCVESSVRAAFDRGLRTFVVADATAAHTESLHLGALRSLAQGFSTVLSAAEVRRALAPSARPRPAKVA